MNPIDFVAIDFETANERRDSACAVAIAIVRGGEIETRSWLLRPPDMRFSAFNIGIHGITPEMVENAPTFNQIWPEISGILGSAREIWAHNAPFDQSVLAALGRRYGLSTPSGFRCSVKLARQAWPELPSHKLNVVCGHLGIPLDHHDAASDAQACAQIVLAARRKDAVGCGTGAAGGLVGLPVVLCLALCGFSALISMFEPDPVPAARSTSSPRRAASPDAPADAQRLERGRPRDSPAGQAFFELQPPWWHAPVGKTYVVESGRLWVFLDYPVGPFTKSEEVVAPFAFYVERVEAGEVDDFLASTIVKPDGSRLDAYIPVFSIVQKPVQQFDPEALKQQWQLH